jgi:hypothetical protein
MGSSAVSGRAVHTVYEEREVIDPENDEFRLYVR